MVVAEQAQTLTSRLHGVFSNGLDDADGLLQSDIRRNGRRSENRQLASTWWYYRGPSETHMSGEHCEHDTHWTVMLRQRRQRQISC